MKKIFLLLIILLSLNGCLLPNDTINPTEFHFYLNEKLENVENSLFKSDFDFKELDYGNNWTHVPHYNLSLKQNDTIINYLIRLSDCENYNSLLNYNEELRNCKKTFIGIKKYSGNFDSISNTKAKEIFKINFIDKLRQLVDSEKVEYQIKINRNSEDSIIVSILDDQQKIRKKRIFTNHRIGEKFTDSLSKNFKQTEVIDFRKSSIVIYKYNKNQHYMYIESKKTMPNNGYN